MRISIAIPTRERAIYLKSLLATCVAIEDDNLEIIVSDNASEDNTREVVESFGDPRIRYLNTGRRVSQRMNFENAIRAATGDYVMTVGDDDAILAGQWRQLRAILEREKPNALTWLPLYYYWPGESYRGGGGMLRVNRKHLFGAPMIRDTAGKLAKVGELELGRYDRLPEIYHGVASRALIERFIEKTGAFFLSAQVDIYYSVGALALLDNYHVIHHPFSIIAMGPKSGGGSMQIQARTGDASEIIARVVRESAIDPVKEILTMPFPSLGFHLLAGIVEAQRHIVGDRVKLDWDRYTALLASQLRNADAGKRRTAIGIMDSFFGEMGIPEQSRAFASIIEALPPASGKHADRRRMFDSVSYLLPTRFEIDLKAHRMADVKDAARVADWLIGPSAQPPGGRGSRWLATLLRASAMIMRLGGPQP